jgi:polyisoprenoid-binding protein YceI
MPARVFHRLHDLMVPIRRGHRLEAALDGLATNRPTRCGRRHTETMRRVSGHGDVSQAGAVSASIRIDAASLDTGNRRRDDHLRSADFFDTDTHPSVEITTSRVEPPTSSEEWSVAADLTAAGRTEPVELELTLEDASEQSVRVRGKLVTDRTRFGMTWSPMRMASSIAELDADLRFVRNDRH